ncbi:MULTISPECIES: phospho-sugar mutase [Pontibacillus]|uniref:Phosphoglucomutase n=1 Tax=Pontibacillus chungwhensis TaxID=265426 RepID=A0ABY8UWU9_9BACI|nr:MULTISPECIES: phospho-sugar mutase [Pontibacillus]MCD5323947.1 phospho-sugar mutase [Pontibacillus sp. HN14]WIF97987.1 phospho-sugar mutase [Pontibacillus chungwhensis]
MTWKATFEKWKQYDELETDLGVKLKELEENPAELEDAFYKTLTFGTGGMRGILGPGTNRMNTYTIRKAVEGLALYMLEHIEGARDKGVAIAYDSRYMSQEFSVEAARVLGAHGIKAYVYESLRPTPYLSFAVRHLQTAAGIMITASHNPPEYNGFKVYNDQGAQMPPAEANELISYVNSVESELTVPVLDQEEIERDGLLNWIGEDVDKAYMERLMGIIRNPEMIREQSDISIVFTPLHGTAYQPVLNGLEQAGFTNVHVVEEQAKPDPEFSTVSSPNPEEHQAFAKAIELGKEKGADLLIATDPDADRLGVAVQNEEGEYEVLTGNQLGTLTIDYLLSQTTPLPEDATVIKTIVTTEMGRKVAEHYGARMIETLTGFKFIAEQIEAFNETGDGTFLYGFEESYGYLVDEYVRDKDAVQAAITASELAAYWRQEGKTLYQALRSLYERHGYYLEGLHSLTLKGKEGTEKIQQIMDHFREEQPSQIGSYKVIAVEDYSDQTRTFLDGRKSETIDLPKENVVKYILEEDAWCCLRPSGTEPKIKCYFGVKTDAPETSAERLEELKEAMVSKMESVIQESVK